jgi:thioredoxin-dependent peroxiredoxin
VIEVGTTVPDLVLADDQGQEVRLRELQGRPYVLFFYPKDDTPGCTKEACNFRDNYSTFREAGIEVIGVSPDSTKSHAKFRDKYQLPYRLLSDPDHSLAEAFGAWGEKTYMGKQYMGILRSTFVIDADGTVQHVYPDVKPDEHAVEILRDLGKQ